MQNSRIRTIGENILLSFCGIAVLVVGFSLWRAATRSPGDTPQLVAILGASTQQSSEDNNTNSYSGITILVNKDNPLPLSYVPDSLMPIRLPGSEEAVAAEVIVEPLRQMFSAAESEEHELIILSAYRSFADQTIVYQSFVDGYSQAYADQVSARPGYSEHQTGLAVDVGLKSGECELDVCFGNTSAGVWLANNAHRFGFVIRYEDNKQMQTGYSYEPWHLRYFGETLATELFNTKKSYEEYLAGR